MERVIKTIARRFGYTINKLQDEQASLQKNKLSARDFFALYFCRVSPKDFFFVQIGANDGQSGDPIYEFIKKYRLSGILVEPQKDAFERLQKNYLKGGHRGLNFANIAIGHQSGRQVLYTVKEEYKNEENFFKMTRIASFNKEVFQKTLHNKIPTGANPDHYTQEITVDTYSFEKFVQKYSINKIDFLQIDCEGYDWEIIKMIDFNKFSPSAVNYESAHLNDVDRADCEDLLKLKGYQVFTYGKDTCAFK